MRAIRVLAVVITTTFLGLNCKTDTLPSKNELIFHKSHEPKKIRGAFF